jgi:hypothetical protein
MASTMKAWVVMPNSFAAVAECFFSVSLNLMEVVLDLPVVLLLILLMDTFCSKKRSIRAGMNAK